MDVIRLIEDLEDMLEVSNTIPLTGKVMVDKEEVMHILDQLKNQIPQDVSNAQNIVAKENEILEDANMQAKQIVQAAHMEAQKLVDEDELVILAQEKAKEMMDRAEEESTQIRKSSREYVDGLLEETQVQLSDLIKTINANRQELRNE
ncbi:ATPase [Peptoniphilus sp. KCTC 25270]|uniref:ATPase n=1 Tax=Peptoniphilus sp. KCTC 25270 TaxID=2897414 RepID=UPI001E41C674|nr:ATPase [Peptoniphilus sp. KCTC 25270]MCD1147099.1 ATPase [Peptoniphilus sp. KCTC 25270]